MGVYGVIRLEIVNGCLPAPAACREPRRQVCERTGERSGTETYQDDGQQVSKIRARSRVDRFWGWQNRSKLPLADSPRTVVGKWPRPTRDVPGPHTPQLSQLSVFDVLLTTRESTILSTEHTGSTGSTAWRTDECSGCSGYVAVFSIGRCVFLKYRMKLQCPRWLAEN